MTSPFENPANAANRAKGIKWPSAAMLVAGVGLAGWLVFVKGNPKPQRGDPQADGEPRKNPLRPPPGDTTQQMYTDRYSQQHRTPPPSQKTDMGR